MCYVYSRLSTDSIWGPSWMEIIFNQRRTLTSGRTDRKKKDPIGTDDQTELAVRMCHLTLINKFLFFPLLSARKWWSTQSAHFSPRRNGASRVSVGQDCYDNNFLSFFLPSFWVVLREHRRARDDSGATRWVKRAWHNLVWQVQSSFNGRWRKLLRNNETIVCQRYLKGL